MSPEVREFKIADLVDRNPDMVPFMCRHLETGEEYWLVAACVQVIIGGANSEEVRGLIEETKLSQESVEFLGNAISLLLEEVFSRAEFKRMRSILDICSEHLPAFPEEWLDRCYVQSKRIEDLDFKMSVIVSITHFKILLILKDLRDYPISQETLGVRSFDELMESLNSSKLCGFCFHEDLFYELVAEELAGKPVGAVEITEAWEAVIVKIGTNSENPLNNTPFSADFDTFIEAIIPNQGLRAEAKEVRETVAYAYNETYPNEEWH